MLYKNGTFELELIIMPYINYDIHMLDVLIQSINRLLLKM